MLCELRQAIKCTDIVTMKILLNTNISSSLEGNS